MVKLPLLTNSPILHSELHVEPSVPREQLEEAVETLKQWNYPARLVRGAFRIGNEPSPIIGLPLFDIKTIKIENNRVRISVEVAPRTFTREDLPLRTHFTFRKDGTMDITTGREWSMDIAFPGAGT